MSNGMWLCKEDMIRDLGLNVDIDDNFLAIGEMPPKPPAYSEVSDNELELFLGVKPKKASISQTSHNKGSDLEGIKEMLRMVENYEEPKEDIKSEKNMVGIISKLNPNVKEFVPRSAVSPVNQPTETNTCTKVDTKVSSPPKQTVTVQECSEADCQEVAALLKDQISNAAKEDSFEKTREKNTAIAKLLKLYAGPARNTITTQPKLYTPQFFEQCKASDYNKMDADVPKPNHNFNNTKVNLLTPDKITLNNDNLASSDMEICSVIENKPIKAKPQTVVESNATSLTQDMSEANIEGDSEVPFRALPTEAEVKDSINKVNAWFSEKPSEVQKPKSPTVYLGTVAFKRKDTAACKSPSEVDKKISKGSNDVYVPTKYADELLKEFEMRKDKELQKMDVFDRLYHDLKQKDAEIRKGKKTDTNA